MVRVWLTAETVSRNRKRGHSSGKKGSIWRDGPRDQRLRDLWTFARAKTQRRRRGTPGSPAGPGFGHAGVEFSPALQRWVAGKKGMIFGAHVTFARPRGCLASDFKLPTSNF